MKSKHNEIQEIMGRGYTYLEAMRIYAERRK